MGHESYAGFRDQLRERASQSLPRCQRRVTDLWRSGWQLAASWRRAVHGGRRMVNVPLP
jgi:hypothetical protein